MQMGTVVECQCGHKIGLTELLAHGFIVEDNEPVFVYVRYRCEECGTEGEHLMDYDEWNSRIREPEIVEKISRRFEALGPISADEVITFARGIRTVTSGDVAALDV
ncbi:MAG: hypothetical protein ACLFWB_00375 [Armatimonadota bacterium]